MEYDLEYDTIIARIKSSKAQKVCIQLPDGLKPQADPIQKRIQDSTGVQVFIWAGSCYGACDIPQGLDSLGIDLLIQIGHSEWK
jgi:2-(3-amino-3-carboxypropyl)histidine synthase